MRAYSLHRPIGMGTYPKPESGSYEIVNWPYQYTPEVKRYTFGYVDYENDMPVEELERYEMLTEDMVRPNIPPESIVKAVAQMLVDERFEDANHMFDVVEEKGYDGEAFANAVDEILQNHR